MGQVTLSTDEYHQLLANTEEANRKIADLNQQLIVARSEDPAHRLATIQLGFEAALAIAKFAVAELPAESHKGWPHVELDRLADAIIASPDGTSSNSRDLAMEFRRFAREAKMHEQRRAAKTPNLNEHDVFDPNFKAGA